MSILIFSESSFPRHPGGAGKSTHVLPAALAKRGHRIRILCECKEQDEVEHVEGVEVHRINLGDTNAALEVLSSWPEATEGRCAGCSRSKLARSQLTLATHGRFSPRRLAKKLSGSWSATIARNVSEMYPLGIVQRDMLRRGS